MKYVEREREKEKEIQLVLGAEARTKAFTHNGILVHVITDIQVKLTFQLDSENPFH